MVMDYAKALKLRFRAGDLDLLERRNRYFEVYQSSGGGGRRFKDVPLWQKQ